jgi:hypothetical protein
VCFHQGTQTPRDLFAKQGLEWALDLRYSFPPPRGFRSFGDDSGTWMSQNSSNGGIRWLMRRLFSDTAERHTPFASTYVRDERACLAINGDPEDGGKSRWAPTWMTLDRSPRYDYALRTRREWLTLLLLLLLLGLGIGLGLALFNTTEPPEAGPLYAFKGMDRETPGKEAASTDLGSVTGTDQEVMVPAAEFQYGFGKRFPVSCFKGMPYTQRKPTGENRFAQMEVFTHHENLPHNNLSSAVGDVMADGIDARASGPDCVQVRVSMRCAIAFFTAFFRASSWRETAVGSTRRIRTRVS